jgi:ABC-type polar amino acid transport system ATPase subunit
MSTIRVEGLKKDFADQQVLNGIDLEIPVGQLVCIIGRSGCGKSTLLRCMNGLEEFHGGRIAVGDESLDASDPGDFHRAARMVRQKVGFVFQQFQLFPHLNLLENVMMAQIVVKRVGKSEARQKSMALLERVGLGSFLNRFPGQLSGGQQQRGAIARALALQPQVMLYDEPTSALDPELVDEVLQVMKTLDREENLTQVVVTHEMRFAREAADRIIFIDEGRVVEQGPPEVLFTQPRDERTKQFLRKFI